MCSSFWPKNNMTVIPHPPYSPDRAPCDFFLFPCMKCQMKGKPFADVSEVRKKTLGVLNNISTEEFQRCFQQWEKCWYKCIESKGEYSLCISPWSVARFAIMSVYLCHYITFNVHCRVYQSLYHYSQSKPHVCAMCCCHSFLSCNFIK